MPKSYTTVGVRFEDEEWQELLVWREAQPVVPSTSAAVRHLVKLGLEAVVKQKKTSNG